jgi:hypothetical protein
MGFGLNIHLLDLVDRVFFRPVLHGHSVRPWSDLILRSMTVDVVQRRTPGVAVGWWSARGLFGEFANDPMQGVVDENS